MRMPQSCEPPAQDTVKPRRTPPRRSPAVHDTVALFDAFVTAETFDGGRDSPLTVTRITPVANRLESRVASATW